MTKILLFCLFIVSVFDTCYRANIRISNYGTMTSRAVAPSAKFTDWVLRMSYAQSDVLSRYNVMLLMIRISTDTLRLIEPDVNNLYETSPVLAIVIPTYNERDNIEELVVRMDRALLGVRWEAIFVDDDSVDGTADVVRKIGRKDIRVHCIQRIGRRGLSSAVIEGMMATTAPYIAVMDADLQHDECLLPKMLEVLNSSDTDIVIGSRMVEGGDNQNLGGLRRWGSEVASKLTRRILDIQVRDLMSGFFMLRREVLEETVRNLSGVGFKILLDILASSHRPLTFVELPYKFRSRHAGESKMDTNVAVTLVFNIIEKKLGGFLPSRLLAFLMVGSFGVAVHFAVLSTLLKFSSVSFVVAQATATLVAMTSNFFMNNFFTYQDVRLRGWKLMTGWFSFTLACSFGAIANVGVASTMYNGDFSWGVSAIAGILIGTAWNFGVTKMYTWQLK